MCARRARVAHTKGEAQAKAFACATRARAAQTPLQTSFVVIMLVSQSIWEFANVRNPYFNNIIITEIYILSIGSSLEAFILDKCVTDAVDFIAFIFFLAGVGCRLLNS